MNKNPKISIIVPIYKIENYIERCVSSLTSQDYDNIEILLIDDGSPDNCGKICDEISKNDKRIKVFHKENGGLSDARNFGFEKSVGDYILFIDGDDYINSDACSSLLADATKLDADIVTGHANLLKQTESMDILENNIKENFEYHKVYSGKEYILKCLKTADLRVEVWRSLYKRDFLIKNDLKFQKGITHEDEEFTPRALLKAKRVVLSDCCFYNYDNSRENSIMNSSNLNLKRAYDIIKIHETLLPIYKKVEPRELRRRLQDNLCWKYLDCVCRYRLVEQKDFTPARLQTLKNAYRPKRRIKALIFAISPKLFFKVMG